MRFTFTGLQPSNNLILQLLAQQVPHVLDTGLFDRFSGYLWLTSLQAFNY